MSKIKAGHLPIALVKCTHITWWGSTCSFFFPSHKEVPPRELFVTWEGRERGKLRDERLLMVGRGVSGNRAKETLGNQGSTGVMGKGRQQAA